MSRLISIVLMIVFFSAVGTYSYYKVYPSIHGPDLILQSVPNETENRAITLKGTATRIVSLAVNGNTVDTDEKGKFELPYLLSQGSNIIFVEATDKYNNKIARQIEVYYSSPITPANSSSTTTHSPDNATQSLDLLPK